MPYVTPARTQPSLSGLWSPITGFQICESSLLGPTQFCLPPRGLKRLPPVATTTLHTCWSHLQLRPVSCVQNHSPVQTLPAFNGLTFQGSNGRIISPKKPVCVFLYQKESVFSIFSTVKHIHPAVLMLIRAVPGQFGSSVSV